MRIQMYVNICVQISVYIDLYTSRIDFHPKVIDARFDDKKKKKTI